MQDSATKDASHAAAQEEDGRLAGLRRPGETAFMAALSAASLFLFWSAYTISGFDMLSSPGAMPMTFTGVMSVTALACLVGSIRKERGSGETFAAAILPFRAVALILLIAGYALLLRPLGFLPTSMLFMVLAIMLLSRRGLLHALAASALTVASIYAVFRLVFAVLTPEGVVPEAEIIAAARALFGGR